jgi:hypothetical protein
MVFSTISENPNMHQEERSDAFPIKFYNIRTIPTPGSEVKIIIRSLKRKISQRHDGITGKVLTVLSSLISQPLTHICIHSVLTEILLDCLKISEVIPLYKPGDIGFETNFTINYISKVLEKDVCNRLSHYLQTNITLVPKEFDLGKKLSKENTALNLTENALKSINNKCVLVEYSVIYQKLLTVRIIKFC